MAEASIVKVADNQYSVKGVLMMHTVMPVLTEINGYLKSASEVSLDFKEVQNSDSAAVALIIAWLAKAKQTGTRLHLTNLPQQITDIARASDLLDILPIE